MHAPVDGFPLRVGWNDLAAMTGRPEAEVRAVVDAETIEPLAYRAPTSDELGTLLAELAETFARSDGAATDAGRQARWEAGWGEVLARVERDGVSEATLAPQYFRHTLMRFRGRYIRTADAGFEPALYRALKAVLFRAYLAGVPRIVELGCGTGLNLLQLSRMFPETALLGCDWARPSQALTARIAAATGAALTGTRFDMRTLAGREAVPIAPDTAVITLHALEQLGTEFGPLLDWLIAARPRVVLHIEPIVELYTADDPFDALAVAFHRKRRYLTGFLPALRAREAAGAVEILEARRLGFGSPFHEAYSAVAWRVAA